MRTGKAFGDRKWAESLKCICILESPIMVTALFNDMLHFEAWMQHSDLQSMQYTHTSATLAIQGLFEWRYTDIQAWVSEKGKERKDYISSRAADG